ncbi:hypothetical protein LJC53_07270, partial [Bacteroidales bacterium OttesenSCG-928-C03]|nr:hypothetical protein [Bacteroidales bacterium OttesenSCG-928-C03]
MRVYRAGYLRLREVNLNFTAPDINNSEPVWHYIIDQKKLNLRFDNALYSQTCQLLTPANNPAAFISKYMENGGVLELDCHNSLFFNVRIDASLIAGATGNLLVETCSVNGNVPSADRFINSRKQYLQNEYANMEIVCENGKSVRFGGSNTTVTGIRLEFYEDVLEEYNRLNMWQLVGEFALTLDDHEVYQRLEPQALVDGLWPRFILNDRVNVSNYMNRWTGSSEGGGIQELVARFLQASDSYDNPRGVTDLGDCSNSSLDLLNLGATDFHVARMLGLGTIDISQLYYSGCIYAVEYIASKMEPGGKFDTQHITLSLPVSHVDERLPFPVHLKDPIKKGICNAPNTETANEFTDDEGYAPDGRSRYLTLESENDYMILKNAPFNEQPQFTGFNFSETTIPIYGGVKYRIGQNGSWMQPAKSKDSANYGEVIPLAINEGTGVLYIHKQKQNGAYEYGSYGINLFSKVTESPRLVSVNYTELQAKNSLMPPDNVQALLIKEESPLFLTSQNEQQLYAGNNRADKTLVRLTFDYNTHQELSTYKIDPEHAAINDSSIVSNASLYPDSVENYAKELEIFFRGRVPQHVMGKVASITHNHTPGIMRITTAPYALNGAGNTQTLTPDFGSDKDNYIGGVLTIGKERYIIHDITVSGSNPVIFVYENAIGEDLEYKTNTITTSNVFPKNVEDQSGELFMAIENMQLESNWDLVPGTKVVLPSWGVHREVFHQQDPDNQNGTIRFIEKSRGYWGTANVEAITETVDYVKDANGEYVEPFSPISGHKGLYKITFSDLQAPTYTANSNIDFHNGIVRLKRNDAYTNNRERSTLEVIGTDKTQAGKLILYVFDSNYNGDNAERLRTGSQTANYYPGYRVYLYQAANSPVKAEAIQPTEGEEVHYSIFGLRSTENVRNETSNISTPSLMFAQRDYELGIPETIQGPAYATRPDSFGRSTYSFKTRFAQNHEPYGVVFYRTNDELLLNALYKKETVKQIKEELEALGGYEEATLANRWANFLTTFSSANRNVYALYPSSNGFRFPFPDSLLLLDTINQFIDEYNKQYRRPKGESDIAGLSNLSTINSYSQTVFTGLSVTFGDFVRQAIYNCFVPLTEMPVVCKHIRPNNEPRPDKQNIKDKDGFMLNPADPNFDIAPMVKVAQTEPLELLFTDFTLDGTSNNIYFYTAIEIDPKMNTGAPGPISSPIKMVNTNPLEAPEVRRLIPVLPSPETEEDPFIRFEVSAYPANQQVVKYSIFRTNNASDAQSVRTMKFVKDISLDDAAFLQLNEELNGSEVENRLDNTWIFLDDFSDLDSIPYGEPLYYRITASRKVEYNSSTLTGSGSQYQETGESVVAAYAPSKPSKIIGTMVVETSSPEAPELRYQAQEPQQPANPTVNNFNYDVENVVLKWDNVLVRGKYHVYKMNASHN